MNASRIKYTLVALATLLLCLPSATGQVEDVSLDPEAGGRLTVGLDKKITRGLHLTLEQEARMDNNFGAFDRLQTNVGLRYKLLPWLKVGAGYALIAPYSSKNSAFKDVRHRVMLDATATAHFGLWQLSLKERVQLTHRTGDFNVFQNPANLLGLKSRLTAKYKGLRRLTPYAYAEMRHVLNAPVVSALYNGSVYMTSDGSTEGDPGWFLTGFDGVYVNRLRGCVGVEYRLDRRSRLDFALMLDWVNDREVDANSEGTVLKSYTREHGLVGHLVVGYEYSF